MDNVYFERLRGDKKWRVVKEKVEEENKLKKPSS